MAPGNEEMVKIFSRPRILLFPMLQIKSFSNVNINVDDYRKSYFSYPLIYSNSNSKGGIQAKVFENRQIFAPKRDANGVWRRLHSEKLHSLYHSLNIVRMIKYISLNWAGHVARMGNN